MRSTYLAPAVALLLVLASCGAALTSPSPTPAPAPLPVAELKYRLFAEVGEPWFCDPDYYPIARTDEEELALQRFPEIQHEPETYRAILRHNRLDGVADLTADQKLVVYRDWKRLNALRLESMNDVFAFWYRVLPKPGTKEGAIVDGRITLTGKVLVLNRQPAGPPICPICLASTSRIDTPAGRVPITELRPGDLVWTLSASGARVPALLLAVASVEAPVGHEVVRVTLADGRAVVASPGHPTADGRTVAKLAVGDALDGSRVRSVVRLPYTGRTYDVLPAGPTGAYWVGGVLLGSTLSTR